ncbi:Uncharacterised protein [Mycobacterium tuberculosis]|nr:Uncharacterised protein [Mycobacterium tuberculosis]
MDDEDIGEVRRAEAHGQAAAPRELLCPAHRPRPDVQRVEVHVAQPQQGGAEHVALTAPLLRDEAVRAEGLHQAVDGRRRKTQGRRQVGDPEVAGALEQVEDLRCAVDRLDHARAPSGRRRAGVPVAGSTLTTRQAPSIFDNDESFSDFRS